MKNIIINQEEVKKEVLISNKGEKITHNGRIIHKYSVHAFSESNKPSMFFENFITTDTELKNNKGSLCSALFFQITSKYSWDIISGHADKWGCLLFQNYETKDQIYIEFNLLEHGLLGAYIIAKKLKEEY